MGKRKKWDVMSCVCKDLFVIPPSCRARDGSAHMCVLLFPSLAHHFSTVSLGYLWPIHLFIFPLAYAFFFFSFILCCICNAFLLFRFEISLFLSFNRNTYIHTSAVDVISFPNWRRNDTHSRSIFESDGISTSLRFSYRFIDWELYCCCCWRLSSRHCRNYLPCHSRCCFVRQTDCPDHRRSIL